MREPQSDRTPKPRKLIPGKILTGIATGALAMKQLFTPSPVDSRTELQDESTPPSATPTLDVPPAYGTPPSATPTLDVPPSWDPPQEFKIHLPIVLKHEEPTGRDEGGATHTPAPGDEPNATPTKTDTPAAP